MHLLDSTATKFQHQKRAQEQISGVVLQCYTVCRDLCFIFHYSVSSGLSVLGSVLCLLLTGRHYLTVLPV